MVIDFIGVFLKCNGFCLKCLPSQVESGIIRLLHRTHSCPGGGIGRRRGLKIPRRKVCRFESGPGHQIQKSRSFRSAFLRLHIPILINHHPSRDHDHGRGDAFYICYIFYSAYRRDHASVLDCSGSATTNSVAFANGGHPNNNLDDCATRVARLAQQGISPPGCRWRY